MNFMLNNNILAFLLYIYLYTIGEILKKDPVQIRKKINF